MVKNLLIVLTILLFTGLVVSGYVVWKKNNDTPSVAGVSTKPTHWFMLYRKSNIEELYYGVPGNTEQSRLIKTFQVKTGRPGERPTPLPQLAGKEYWTVIDKTKVEDNPETAPYFLTLDVPAPEVPPYGPEPYLECNGQCDWVTFGYFGLHGVNGDNTRLSKENEGSSGCIRHRDEDITYLYNLLDPKKEEIRYYIEDK